MAKLGLTDLHENQQAAVTAGYENDAICLVCPLGFGKTVIGNLIATERIRDGINKRCLVVAPKKLMQQWVREVSKWDCLTEVVEAVGASDQREAIIQDPRNVIVCLSIDLLKWFKDTFKDPPFDLVIIDELSKFSSAGAVSVKAMKWLRKRVKAVVALTGNPVMESPLALYAQCYVLDGGKTLGRNQEAFKREYFYATDYMGYNWALQPGGGERLMKKVAPLFFSAQAGEYTESLPELKETYVEVSLPEAVWDQYEEIARDMLLEIGNAEIEASNAAVLSSKLEQLVQGALYDTESQWHSVHHAKRDALFNLICAYDRRQVVMYYFKYELEWLKAAFPNAIVLNEDKDALERFEREEDALLLIHPRSAAHGLNLQAASRMVCTKPIWSADQWTQVVARIWRRGQTESCERITLTVSDSIDDVILDRLYDKQKTGRGLLDHLVKFK